MQLRADAEVLALPVQTAADLQGDHRGAGARPEHQLQGRVVLLQRREQAGRGRVRAAGQQAPRPRGHRRRLGPGRRGRRPPRCQRRAPHPVHVLRRRPRPGQRRVAAVARAERRSTGRRFEPLRVRAAGGGGCRRQPGPVVPRQCNRPVQQRGGQQGEQQEQQQQLHENKRHGQRPRAHAPSTHDAVLAQAVTRHLSPVTRHPSPRLTPAPSSPTMCRQDEKQN